MMSYLQTVYKGRRDKRGVCYPTEIARNSSQTKEIPTKKRHSITEKKMKNYANIKMPELY